MNILTTENAKTAKSIRSIANPEWGTKRFNYNAQPLTNGRFASTRGTGFNSVLIFEDEYHFWEVVV